MKINNPDNLPNGLIHSAIVLMQNENPKRTITEITVRATAEPDEYSITPIFGTVPFDRIRRITGYLVGNMSRWNNAKQAEESDRVKHGEDKP